MFHRFGKRTSKKLIALALSTVSSYVVLFSEQHARDIVNANVLSGFSILSIALGHGRCLCGCAMGSISSCSWARCLLKSIVHGTVARASFAGLRSVGVGVSSVAFFPKCVDLEPLLWFPLRNRGDGERSLGCAASSSCVDVPYVCLYSHVWSKEFPATPDGSGGDAIPCKVARESF